MDKMIAVAGLARDPCQQLLVGIGQITEVAQRCKVIFDESKMDQ